MYRFNILTSHPIQYQAPFFRELALDPDIDLTVYFRKRIGVEMPFHDKGFQKSFKWDIPLCEGYKHAFVRNAPQLIINLKKSKPDALMLYGWNSFLNILILFRAKSLNIPIFLYGENPLRHEFKKNWLKIFIKKIWLGFLFSKASAFLYIGEENREFYEFYGVREEKLFFAPYAVHNERFAKVAEESRSKKQELKKVFKIKKDSVVILFAGKLIEKKRPFDLLQAFEWLNSASAVPNCSLVFVGDGELRPKLEDYARKKGLPNVHFAGFQNQTKMPLYYAMADIFVLPSGISETWGLVVNEAMCFGLPVIISDMVGCGPDLVRNGENGFIFPVSDKRALASHLSVLVSGLRKREKFGERSFEIIKEYSYARDIQGIREALIKSVAL